MRQRLLEALQAGWNVKSAAAYAGVVRTNVYRMRKTWTALDQELSRIPTRDRFAGDLEAGPGKPVSRSQVSEPPPADDVTARMRNLGLGVLAQIARDPKQRTQDRVSAARALVQAAQGGKGTTHSSPASSAPPSRPVEDATPVTAEQVAKILRIRPA